ncbi:MAG: hypothetical protein FWC96_08930 [Oscillospiraceae bacterium]|nr:hypothetical protein [Oscillospiraceae bacterium]
MPRKKLSVIPGMEDMVVDCFAFSMTRSGKPDCMALQDIYCLKEDKPCPFRKSPAEAATARERAYRRLVRIGRA